MKRKVRRWWIVGGVALLLVAIGIAAVIYPPVPYRFLRGAKLASVEINDSSPVTSTGHAFPSQTAKVYLVEQDVPTIHRLMSDELLPGDGWSVTERVEKSGNRRSTVSLDARKIDCAISVYPSASTKWAMESVRTGKQSVVMIWTKTTRFDRLLAKFRSSAGIQDQNSFP